MAEPTKRMVEPRCDTKDCYRPLSSRFPRPRLILWAAGLRGRAGNGPFRWHDIPSRNGTILQPLAGPGFDAKNAVTRRQQAGPDDEIRRRTPKRHRVPKPRHAELS